MSSLDRRRGDLPERRTRGGMHPGWSCFMSSHWAGFMLGITFCSVFVRATHGWELWPCAIPALIWVALFIIGGRKAEKLWERPE